MNLLNYILKKHKNTAKVAKERLHVIISYERLQRNKPDYLPMLKEEILAVIAKYIPISKEKVSVNLERNGDNTILELNVTIPEEELT